MATPSSPRPSTGALTSIAGSPFTASYTGWGWQSLAINPAGTFAYVGTGNGGQLLNFRVDATTGALTEVPANAYGTGGSNCTVFNPAGTLAYVSNAWVLTVSVANVNPGTGALTTSPEARSPSAPDLSTSRWFSLDQVPTQYPGN